MGEQSVRILTHNVYWFQGAPSRWGNERVAVFQEVFDALCELYESARVDVLCLQEVHDIDLVNRLAQKLGMSSHIHASGGLRPDYGGAILCRENAEFNDCTRSQSGHLHERIHLRTSMAEFEIAAVHLPSNRFADSVEEGDKARVGELTQVLTHSPKPNVLVGDLNCTSESSPYTFMVNAGYSDSAVVARSDTVSKRRLDYIWLDAEYSDRLVRFEAWDDGIFRRESQGDPWTLSDHPPLLVELQ